MKIVPDAAGTVADHAAGEQGGEQRRSVVFVVAQFLPLIGGAEIRALREAKALRAHGHDVCVVTLRLHWTLPPEEVIEGVPVRRVGGLFLRGKLRLRFGAQWFAEVALLRELLRRQRSYEIIHLRQLSWMARPAGIAALLARKPLLVRLASPEPEHTAHLAAGRAVRLYAGSLDPSLPMLHVAARNWVSGDIAALRRAQWLAGLTLRLLRRPGITWIAISTRIRTYMAEHGVPSEQIVVLPNGIEPSSYANVAAQVERVREAWPQEAAVLAVARFTYQKGLDILLHAWARISGLMPCARLLLVGGGTLLPQLDAMARALGVSASVRFTDLVSDVRPFLAEAQVFVLPSRFEGMPNALLEAMAAGLPCVATRVSGSEDLIVDGESGLLVPPEDPAALAEALLTLMTNPERARKLGRAARERIENHFSDTILIGRLVTLYGESTAGTSPFRTAESHASTHRNIRTER